MQKISKNLKQTKEIGGIFMGEIMKKNNKVATVVGLVGDLGAGKTAFTQAVAKHFGIKNKVSSPTFVIMKKYPLKKIRKIKNMIFYFIWMLIV